MLPKTFKAYRVAEDGLGKGRYCDLTSADLGEGAVTVKVIYSSINYKDALAATGRGHILKQFPLVPGIDLAGRVATSTDDRFKTGDAVLVTGCGIGEAHDGGYSEYQRVDPDWIVPLPKGLSLRDSMILGTAGFTAALAIHRLEQMGQTAEQGRFVVTGASGGVGTLAVNMLSARGYDVVAVSGKPELRDFLYGLGARQVSSLGELGLGKRPLESARFGGAIDNVGGEVLSGLLASVNLWGNIASVGLAQSHELKATVMPFILRGVSVLGISSSNCPMPLRRELWSRLAGDMRPQNLAAILTQEVALAETGTLFDDMINRKTHGRILVKCGEDRV